MTAEDSSQMRVVTLGMGRNGRVRDTVPLYNVELHIASIQPKPEECTIQSANAYVRCVSEGPAGQISGGKVNKRTAKMAQSFSTKTSMF